LPTFAFLHLQDLEQVEKFILVCEKTSQAFGLAGKLLGLRWIWWV